MTWKEFKEWAEAHGVRDEHEIGYIDFQGEPAQALSDDTTEKNWQIS